MSIFLSEQERALVEQCRHEEPLNAFYWSLLGRVEHRAKSPGLRDEKATSEWWHHASEYLTDAAMAYALKPSENLAIWLRDTALSVARRPMNDWIGPGFRSHAKESPTGHLETAHLSWSLAIVLDLAGKVFTEEETKEISETLESKGIQLCQRWLAKHRHLNNWRCILMAGVAVPAAVLNKKDAIESSIEEFKRCVDLFQPDGSYGESLQYGNYAMTGLVYTREALIRRQPELAKHLPLKPYCLKPFWDAASLLYTKPLSGWGPLPLPRSVNFNDSAAVYRASADNLLHVASRAKEDSPKAAALARWLFDKLYTPLYANVPPDQSSFGFVNDYGFLTMPLLTQAAEALSPLEAGLGELAAFSCGDFIARDNWNGKTILAIRGGGAPLHAVAHLHSDVNSFILTHNEERLLADAGHACYRNLTRELETSTLTHNTCCFTTNPATEQSQEDQHKSILLQQGHTGRRMMDDSGLSEPPVDRGARRLISQRSGAVTVIGSEASNLYSHPIEKFSRFWLLCGSHVLFVIDRVEAAQPVRTSWSWLLNNRDNALDLKIVHPDRFVARRGNAGMKLFHIGNGQISGPLNSFMHDAYHTLPAQPCEGKAGSGLLLKWQDVEASTTSTTIHAICMDTPGAIAGWYLKHDSDAIAILEDPSKSKRWKLKIDEAFTSFSIEETHNRMITDIIKNNDNWNIST